MVYSPTVTPQGNLSRKAVDQAGQEVCVPRVILTRQAARQLRSLLDERPEVQPALDELFEQMADSGVEAERLEIEGARRPLWGLPIVEHTLWASVGPGPAGQRAVPEIRALGLTRDGEPPPFAALLLADGDPGWTDPERSCVIAARFEQEVYLSEEAERVAELPSDVLRTEPFFHHDPWKEPDQLVLRLGPEQEALLEAPRPLLVQGIAGSGKTTVLVHMVRRLLLEEPASRILLVTYNDKLHSYMLTLLEVLFGGELPENVQVNTWRGLCEDLGSRCEPPVHFDWAPEPSNPRSWAPERTAGKITRDEVLEEIRGVLKGEQRGEDALMPLADYLALPGTVGLHAPKQARRGIWRLAQQYQRHLSSAGQVDDMDAARLLLEESLTASRWDYVLIDEAQDYTRVQLDLLVRLAPSGGLVFVGDEQQVVHPSRFRWPRVKDALYGHAGIKPPDPLELLGNYRCPRPVMELGRKLVDLRVERLGGHAISSAFTDRPPFPRPVHVVASRGDVESLLVDLADRIASFGLIRPSGEKEREVPWSGVGFRRSFTPAQAKGIEFDVVCLDGMGAGYLHLMSEAGKKATSANLAFGFNEVFVSVTRTRSLLVLLDEENARGSLWKKASFESLIEPISIDDLLSIVDRDYRIRRKVDWRRAAMEFQQVKAHAAEAECWERGERPRKAANALFAAGAYVEAAPRLEDHGLLEQAATAWERAGQPHKAAEILEGLEEWARAACCWEAGGRAAQRDYARAGQAWVRAGQHRRAAEAFQRAGKRREAAEQWGLVGEHVQSAKGWHGLAHQSHGEDVEAEREALHQWSLAGLLPPLHERFERWRLRRSSWRRWLHELAEAWINAGHWRESIEFYEAAGAIDEADRALLREAAQQRSEKLRVECLYASAALLERAERFERAAKRYKELGDREHAGRCWQRAAAAYVAGERWREAARITEAQLGQYERAAGYWQRLEEWGKAATLLGKSRQFAGAARMWEKEGDHRAAAQAWERVESWSEAAAQWALVPGKVGELNRRRCEGLAAVESVDVNERRAELARVWETYSQPKKAAQLFEKAQLWADAGRCWRRAQEWKQAGEAFEEAKDWRAAGDAFLRAQEYEQSKEAYLRGELFDEVKRVRRLKAADQAAHHESNGDWLEAGLQWRLAEDPNREREAYLRIERFDLAAEVEERQRRLAGVEQERSDEDASGTEESASLSARRVIRRRGRR